MATNQYLTEKQVSQATGFSLQTLRNWRHVSRGPVYCKVGRSVRYRPQDIERYMEQAIVDPAGGAA